ncbi:MAG: glycosyltransferase, partial [Lentisphaeria bacterium]|nr:glycosyltransferase [Lentisphaeria bacterium]
MSKGRLEGRHIGIACGGTGGHFFPTLAIADVWQQQGGVVTLLVSGHHAADHLRLARERGFAARELPAPRFSKSPAFVVGMAQAILAGRRVVKELSPDVFLGMGSFASVPACLAAVWCRVPLCLHESNAWMGRANRLLSRWAVHAGIGLPLEEKCPCRCSQT